VKDYGAEADATSTISATFNVMVKAIGSDIYLPKNNAFLVYAGKDNVEHAVASTTSYGQPSGASVTTDNYKVSKNNEVTFEVTATYTIDSAANWDLRMNSIKWDTTDAAGITNKSDFMSKLGGADTTTSYEASWISDVEYLVP